MPDEDFSLLVIDDEPNVLYSLRKILEGEHRKVRTARTGTDGLAALRQRQADAVVLDVRLPDMSGLEVFDRVREIDAHLPVVVITAFGDTETAIEAMKRGAYEYLLKPLDLHRLRDVVGKALELSRLRRVPAVIDGEDDTRAGDRIVGRSPLMQEVYKSVGRVATQDVPVLILGESGTGKELVARAVYQHSRRSDGPFLAINCAAIPESLLESELFGHEKGAFTGADRRRIGKFEQCDGGTLFLDEIGDMTPATQAKVLRLLQGQRFERLGGNETIQADVRIIAATNQDLDLLVREGRFRSDLLYRLKVFTIQLPPLRERRDDIPLLVDYYLQRANHDFAKSIRTVSPEAAELFNAYDWPGNVRELQSVVKYALVQAVGDALTADCLPDSVRGNDGADRAADATDLATVVGRMLVAGEGDVYRKAGVVFDRVVLGAAMRHAKGNQVHAAETLGISRTTLRAKLKALGLSVEKHVAGPD